MHSLQPESSGKTGCSRLAEGQLSLVLVELEERKLRSDFTAFFTTEAATTFVWERTQRQRHSSKFMVYIA